jgi:hypothetical protein
VWAGRTLRGPRPTPTSELPARRTAARSVTMHTGACSAHGTARPVTGASNTSVTGTRATTRAITASSRNSAASAPATAAAPCRSDHSSSGSGASCENAARASSCWQQQTQTHRHRHRGQGSARAHTYTLCLSLTTLGGYRDGDVDEDGGRRRVSDAGEQGVAEGSHCRRGHHGVRHTQLHRHRHEAGGRALAGHPRGCVGRGCGGGSGGGRGRRDAGAAA